MHFKRSNRFFNDHPYVSLLNDSNFLEFEEVFLEMLKALNGVDQFMNNIFYNASEIARISAEIKNAEDSDT